jgi:hypothetical protein
MTESVWAFSFRRSPADPDPVPDTAR